MSSMSRQCAVFLRRIYPVRHFSVFTHNHVVSKHRNVQNVHTANAMLTGSDSRMCSSICTLQTHLRRKRHRWNWIVGAISCSLAEAQHLTFYHCGMAVSSEYLIVPVSKSVFGRHFLWTPLLWEGGARKYSSHKLRAFRQRNWNTGRWWLLPKSEWKLCVAGKFQGSQRVCYACAFGFFLPRFPIYSLCDLQLPELLQTLGWTVVSTSLV